MAAGAARPARRAAVALCHEWLAQRRGSEKTFEAMAEALPEADLYALTLSPGAGFELGGRVPSTTFLDGLAVLRDRRELQLPLMPAAWRYATRQRYDLVVTSSHACAKGFWPARSALHLCYCYTPMRYVWLPGVDPRTPLERLAVLPRRLLREWDLRSVQWVDEFAAISTAVRGRIERFYGREAEVIHPPVDTSFFTPAGPGARAGLAGVSGAFALAVSRMIPYKRLDLAIRACHDLRLPLVIAGSGPAEGSLRRLAAELGAEVRFEVSPGDERLRHLYRAATVMIFPGMEDFGIVLVEAQACGTPVVAYGEGGSLDIVVPGETGALAPAQDVASLHSALQGVLESPPDPAACRRNAERFSREEFHRRFLDWVQGVAVRHGLSLVPESAGSVGS